MNWSTCLSALAAFIFTGVLAMAGPAEEHFENLVRPLLAQQCQKCHGEKKQQGGLRLDSRQALLKGGDNGPAVVPGEPGSSLLIRAVSHSTELKMPAAKNSHLNRSSPWSVGCATGQPGPVTARPRPLSTPPALPKPSGHCGRSSLERPRL